MTPITTEYDLEDAYDWSERTTDEFTLFGVVYKEVFTTFDDGHIEREDFRDGALVRFELTDPTDVLPVQVQTIVYDTSGVITSSDTLDDEFQRKVATYDGGVLTSIEMADESDANDGAGLYPWTMITLQLDASGQVVERVIGYDALATETTETNFLYEIAYDQDDSEDWLFVDTSRSGSTETTTIYWDHGGIRAEFVRDGVLDQITEDDLGNVEAWTERLSLFDAQGVIETRFVFNDDGSSLVASYEGGVLTRTMQDDHGTSPDYRSIESFYDANGKLAERVTLYDNRQEKHESFVDGVRSATVQTDISSSVNWEMIETFFDAAGQKAQRLVWYDNGVIKDEYFEAGIRQASIQVDQSADGAAKSWERIETFYGPQAELAERVTFYDDGVVKEERFDGGQRSAIIQTDVNDAKSWELIEAYYDQDAVLAERVTFYDTGVVKEERFDGGQRSAIIQTDVNDAKSWELIEAYYDQDAVLAERVTFYDTGVVKEERFDGGVRSMTIQSDINDAVSWDRIETVYDASGNTAERVTFHDDGSVSIAAYEDGALLGVLREDVADVFDWTVMATLYEDGALVARGTLEDDGDELVNFYENQERIARVEVDGDNSDPWAARLTEYGPEGNVTTTYDAVADLPDEYLSYLGYDSVATA